MTNCDNDKNKHVLFEQSMIMINLFILFSFSTRTVC